MSEALALEWVVNVQGRFTRSVSLVRDAGRPDTLSGYILTPTGRDVLHRLADALRGESPTRAWSLTGPYGSGKSAFALFVAQLLGGEEPARKQARDLLEREDAELCERFFGANGPLRKRVGRLFPVLVTGSRQSLEKVLAASLASTLRTVGRGRPPQIVERLEAIAAGAAGANSSSAVVGLYEEANEYLRRFERDAEGILLIVDELGKFLEYGASNPAQSDVFLLQELAEAAARSARPFLFLAILHQALDRYADHLSASRRSEWAKVQGRFEDVAFEERSEQVLRLLAHAVRHEGDENALKEVRRQALSGAAEAVALGVRVGTLGEQELREYLTACFPLHPLTALAVGPLFRQFAQNERSLFAFLASTEPLGFQEFLRQHLLDATNSETYRLDRLYDYMVASVGSSLFAHHRGKAWAEVQSALERLRDGTDLEVRLAKTVGLLQVLGPGTAVPASQAVLRFALKGHGVSAQKVDAALESLVRRSLLIFRRHLGAYVLWEGSDVDIETRLGEARRTVDRARNVVSLLSQEFPAEALVARRHYFMTGTLRYFDARYAEQAGLEAELSRNLGDADGRVVLCLPLNADEREAMRFVLRSTQAEIPVVAALPDAIVDLQELSHDLGCLRWTLNNTPELETDRAASREVQARLVQTEQSLRKHLDQLFDPGKQAGSRCLWFYRGREVALSSARELNDFLSRVCDEVYSATPIWRNELINRRVLSSAAAAARRNLIEAMLERPEQEFLGITGTPPERSMYETLLASSGLHRKKAGIWGFHRPEEKAAAPILALWEEIDRFLTQTEETRLPVSQFFEKLRQPPFGLKGGVLPVVLAVTLLHHQAQVALYEEGSFVPRPTAAVFERIFRSPGRFELQRMKVAGARSEVFRRYAAMLDRVIAGQGKGQANLLDVVRPLVRLVKELPDYVSKTHQVSEVARAVLRSIREARQPDRLLFTDLPAACGVSAFAAKGRVAEGQLDSFFRVLHDAFAELQRAYPQLLADIERLVLKAFDRSGPLAEVRGELEHEARLVLNLAVDARLKSFLLRIADNTCEDRTWLETLATLLTGKPPTAWDDQDRARFEVQLASSVRTFRHFRVLAHEMEQGGTALLDGDPQMVRVSVTVPDGPELERVVQVPPQFRLQVQRATTRVRRVLEAENLLDKREVSLAILAQVARQLLAEEDGTTAK